MIGDNIRNAARRALGDEDGHNLFVIIDTIRSNPLILDRELLEEGRYVKVYRTTVQLDDIYVSYIEYQTPLGRSIEDDDEFNEATIQEMLPSHRKNAPPFRKRLYYEMERELSDAYDWYPMEYGQEESEVLPGRGPYNRKEAV